MVYVRRNSDGVIVAASEECAGDCTEAVDRDDPQLQGFLGSLRAPHGDNQLQASDHDFVRVLEDVVELLIGKGVIMFTELPESAQQKILSRQRWRSQMSRSLDLLDED